MVTIIVTLEHRHQVWYVVACDFGKSTQLFRLHALPTRQFMSQIAATNYIKRMVLGQLKAVKHDATGADIDCRVKLWMTEEKQRRA